MPGLVGILCDDPKHEGEFFTFDACLLCASTGKPRRCENALPLIAGMRDNRIHRKDAGLSATMLLDCARFQALAQEHDYAEHPKGFWARFRGSLSHALMEAYDPEDPNILQEVRYRKSVVIDGIELFITGQSDFIDLNRKLIVDYKSIGSVSKVKNGPKEGHEEQINIYRWLVAGGQPLLKDDEGKTYWGDPVDYEIRYGGIQYFDMSNQKRHRVRIWPLEETEAFVQERARPFAEWRRTGELPSVLEDVWGKRSWKCAHKWCVLRDVCDGRQDGTVEKGESALAVRARIQLTQIDK